MKVAGRFQVLLTHTSREWDRVRCDRAYLVQRYANPNRLPQLPPFERLAPAIDQQPYSGALTLLDLTVDGNSVKLVARRSIDSPLTIQHTALVGERLVLCFDSFLYVLPGPWHPVKGLDLRPGNPSRIDDPWFGGLHTVFPVDDHSCIVSSSAADAVGGPRSGRSRATVAAAVSHLRNQL